MSVRLLYSNLSLEEKRSVQSYCRLAKIVLSLSPLNVIRVPLHEQQNRLIGLLTQEGLYADGRITMNHPVSSERALAVKSCVEYICSSGVDEREDFCRQYK